MPLIIRNRHIDYSTPSGTAPKPAAAPPPRPRRSCEPRIITVFRPWTPDEVASLRKLCAEGYSYAKIGALLKRAEGSVHKKTKSLGIEKQSAYCGPRRAG